MSNLPDSLKRVLANLPRKEAPPIRQIYTPTETTTILRDGTVYRTDRNGKVKYLRSAPPIS